MTASAAGAGLLDELRQLLDRHDSASTLDDVREIADELTNVLRRTRGRIGRIARKAAVKDPLKPAKPAPQSAAKQEPTPAPTPTPAVEQAPAPTPAAVVAPDHAVPAAPDRPRPAVRRAVAVVLTVVAAGWSLTARAARRVRRALGGRRTAAPAFHLPGPGRRAAAGRAPTVPARRRRRHAGPEGADARLLPGHRVAVGAGDARVRGPAVSTYGYDSRRRNGARRAAYRAVAWRRFRISVVLILVLAAAGTIVYDHLAHPGALTPPSYGHSLDVTRTLSPDPATSTGRP
ncbi:MAG: hypothetical protein ACRDP6_42565 [Actinoallomurus sp.]